MDKDFFVSLFLGIGVIVVGTIIYQGYGAPTVSVGLSTSSANECGFQFFDSGGGSHWSSCNEASSSCIDGCRYTTPLDETQIACQQNCFRAATLCDNSCNAINSGGVKGSFKKALKGIFRGSLN